MVSILINRYKIRNKYLQKEEEDPIGQVGKKKKKKKKQRNKKTGMIGNKKKI